MKRIFGCAGLILLIVQAGFGGVRNPVFHPRIAGVSRQDLVASRQIFWEQDRPVLRTFAAESAQNDSIRILALMVQFEKDEDEKTTGDGHFDLSRSDTLFLDPPPHDRTYFEHQLQALRNYYKHVSQGNLRIGFTVHPSVLELQNPMGFYNPGTTDEAADEGLAKIFRDAIRMAAWSGVPFSDYDVFVVFHAGVGRDIELGYDATPKDIPSAFLNLEDLQKYLTDGDPVFSGISVQNGSFWVTEGLILPETESQEGYEIGLLGTSALMFGFQLGLPALWNTETGVTGIGRWGLMDQGSGNYNGLVPAEPCAWSKVFMGWEKPVTLPSGTDLKIACSKAKSAPHVYRVPLSDHEYFLIENRQYDPNGDGMTKGKDAAGRQVTFTASGQIELTEKIGVITEVAEYDFGLPGSGILIWHVDESVLSEKLAENKVNTDKHHRAVDLEEADGAQDIGEIYGYLQAGAGAETGVLHDAWFADNPVPIMVNKSDSVMFTPRTHPNTKSYSGGNSHLVFSGFSKSDTVMTFSVSNDLMQAGFPKYYSRGLTPYPPLYGDLDGDGFPEIVVATREGSVFAWRHDGSPVVLDNPPAWRVTVSGDSIPYTSPLFVDAGDSITVPPVIMNRPHEAILVVGIGQHVLGWRVENNRAAPVFNQTVETGKVAALAVIDDYLCVGSSTGKILVLDQTFVTRLEGSDPEGIACFAESYNNTSEFSWTATDGGDYFRMDAVKQLFVWEEPGKFNLEETEISHHLFTSAGGFVLTSSNNRLYLPNNLIVQTGDTPPGDFAVALADVNGDSRLDVIYSSGGQLRAVDFNGVTTENFPFPAYERSVAMSSPVAADVDGDGRIDLCVTTDDGNLEIYDPDGKQIEGAPFAVGGTLSITPTLADVDHDGDIDCITVSNEGVLQVWDFSGAYSESAVPWGSYLHDPQHTALNSMVLIPPQPGSDFFPTNRVYNYPNPNIENFTVIRYRLEQSAKISIKIYDLAGELIDSFSGPGNAPADNEVTWNLDGVDAGVYFCQVKASGAAGEKTATFKIAVIK